MATKKSLEAQIRILVKESMDDRIDMLRLRKELTAAQERMEELERRLAPGSMTAEEAEAKYAAIQMRRFGRVSPRITISHFVHKEVRASARLDKNLDGSDVTRSDEAETPDDD